MITERVFIGTGAGAEADHDYIQAVYNDTSNSLLVGMPLYVSCLDAAEWNNRYSTTALVPAVNATGQYVLLGTNAAVSQLCPIGAFAPENPAYKPAKGDTIRILRRGTGLVAAVTYNAGTAVLVGDYLVADTTPGVRAASGHNTPVLAQTLGIVLATAAAITKGASILATGGGTVTAVVNAYLELR